jgi:hypothetical protein
LVRESRQAHWRTPHIHAGILVILSRFCRGLHQLPLLNGKPEPRRELREGQIGRAVFPEGPEHLARDWCPAGDAEASIAGLCRQ